jgi:hypothetical protein
VADRSLASRRFLSFIVVANSVQSARMARRQAVTIRKGEKLTILFY